MNEIDKICPIIFVVFLTVNKTYEKIKTNYFSVPLSPLLSRKPISEPHCCTTSHEEKANIVYYVSMWRKYSLELKSKSNAPFTTVCQTFAKTIEPTCRGYYSLFLIIILSNIFMSKFIRMYVLSRREGGAGEEF